MRWRAIIRWAALIAAAAAAAIAANVFLLGVAESRNDPVGRLTPRILVEHANAPASPTENDAPGTEPAQTASNDDDDDDESPAHTEVDDSHADEPGEEDDD